VIVYKATNIINRKCYIGQTRCSFSKRKKEHFQDAKHHRDSSWRFHKAIRKYGWKNFKWKILYETDNQEDLNEKEIYFIKQLTIRERYNIVEECGTYERTPEFRKKFSKIIKKQFQNGRESWLKGGTHSKEARKKISENHVDVSGENNPGYGKQYWLGKKHTEETKKKMSIKSKQRQRDKFGRFI